MGLLFGKLSQLKDKQEVLQPLRRETAIVTISVEANLIISFYIYNFHSIDSVLLESPD